MSESTALEMTSCPIAKSPFILSACSCCIGILAAAPMAIVSGVTGFDVSFFGKYRSTLISSIPRANPAAKGEKFFTNRSPCIFVWSNFRFIFFMERDVVLPEKSVFTATCFKTFASDVLIGFLLSVFNNACKSNGATVI